LGDHNKTLNSLLSSPNISSKRWVHEQYDTMVRTNTVNAPGASDSGVIRVKGTSKGLAVKTDCNGRYVYLNPRRGGQIAVAEAARNVVCSGAKPVAITNCLNFGNPYKPEVYWTFREAVGGMGDACRALNTPVTGGNVSLYNENPNAAIFPTPVIGMLGVVEDVEKHTTTPAFKQQNDIVYYLGGHRKGLGGSEYLKTIHGLTTGNAPELDLELEVKLQRLLLEAIQTGLINAAHDVSDGGLVTALAEMAIFGNTGANLTVKNLYGSVTEVLYSEAQSGVVVTVQAESARKLEIFLEKHDLPFYELGSVGGDTLLVDEYIDRSVKELEMVYESALPAAMER
ncbi:MAG: phosphoribosylformylglycinamidine synthase subunit PurL, partial [Bacteroidetes bacterium]|nr:phosphoribosylformylglycinamidine synthase subunit PurL [Bacteroidota bacterium]